MWATGGCHWSGEFFTSIYRMDGILVSGGGECLSAPTLCRLGRGCGGSGWEGGGDSEEDLGELGRFGDHGVVAGVDVVDAPTVGGGAFGDGFEA